MTSESTSERTMNERLEAIEQAVKDGPKAPLDPKEPADFAGDKAGAGRYILGFLLASFLGLWAVYWARYYGWRGIWISLAITVIGVIALVALDPSFGCQEGLQDGPQGYGYYTCP